MEKIQAIEKAVLKYFPIEDPELLKDKTRKMKYREPRHIIWFIVAEKTKIKFARARLAEYYKRNWESIDEAIKRISGIVEWDKKYSELINQITSEIPK